VLRHAELRRRTPCLPILLVVGLAACGRAGSIRTDEVQVRMVAHNTAWQASYVIARPGGIEAVIPTGREVHVPIGAEVRFALTSLDYISDFTLPGLGLRDFCAPGLPSEMRFTAREPGRFLLRGDQLCGLPHTDKSRGWLVVETPDAFRDWIERRARSATG
jgi:heme/copper-type cytochrome/quinol oxidase subunit 2